MDFLRLFLDGGFIMYPLLLCSLLIWAVILEKVYYFKKFEKQSQYLQQKTLGLLQQNKWEEAKGFLSETPAVIREPYLVLFERPFAGQSSEEAALLQNKILRKLTDTQMKLKSSLWILGTIGSSAPFIGLFGTVVGIIKSFNSIAVSGKSGFSVVAAGLSEALIATAAGIVVAVMAIIFYNYFQVRLKNITTTFRHNLEEVVDFLQEYRGAGQVTPRKE